MRKWKWLVVIIILGMTVSFVVIQAKSLKTSSSYQMPYQEMSNILVEQEDQTSVNQTYTEADLLDMNFELVASSSAMRLYLNRSLLNIAIYDERNDYIWFGYYPEYQQKGYTNTLKQWIESGVTIDYFDSVSLNEARMSITDPDAGTQISYQMQSGGFKAAINMVKLGISFELVVALENDEVSVHIPFDSIVEVPYKTAAMKFAKEYKVQSIIVFPYLGSENYEINGYAMIPDGSGALIKYENKPYDSAYVKRIYGRDLGIQSSVTSSAHLKEETTLSLPIYGINHGYHQAAFLAELTSGFGASELHSYPYMYNAIDINTTFFMYKTRDRALIELSGGAISSIPIINKDPYPFDYEVKYSFLANEKAHYAGMAERYRDHLELEQDQQLEMDMHLELVGIDQKPSLFGQTNVRLTTYQEAKEIILDVYEDIKHLEVTYRSFNQGGTYGKTPYRFKLSSALGGRRQFNKLMDAIDDLDGVTLSLENSPLVLANTRVFDTQIRKTTLNLFEVGIDSSRDDTATLLSIQGLAERILKDDKRYNSYGIDHLSIKGIGDLSFSYQRNKETIYREEMIGEMREELMALDDYYIGLYQPVSYFYSLISSYYETPYQANSYAYITQSIPFISLVLSGSVKLYSPLLNYVNNLDEMTLKMIEYNLRPSFIVTSKPGYELRYTHVEYLYTTEYSVFEDVMKDVYRNVSDILSDVQGEHIVNHRYIALGVAEITYESKIIYVNYTDQSYTVGTTVVQPLSATSVEVTP